MDVVCTKLPATAPERGACGQIFEAGHTTPA
jgi:hypothetical protein